MELDIIFQLAFSLTCRLWMNFLCACTELDPVQMVGAVDVLLRHQEHSTALDWIVVCKRRAQLRLPERCESRQCYEIEQEMSEIRALLARSRAEVAKSQALRAEVQTFLDQCKLRHKRMERQEATGFTQAEREAIEEHLEMEEAQARNATTQCADGSWW